MSYRLHEHVANIRLEATGGSLADHVLSPETIDWNVTPDPVCLYGSILRPSDTGYRMLCQIWFSTG